MGMCHLKKNVYCVLLKNQKANSVKCNDSACLFQSVQPDAASPMHVSIQLQKRTLDWF